MQRLIAPIVLGLAGLSVLLSLGFWQLRRLDWKEGILAEIDARIIDAPVAVPAVPDRVEDRFLPVTATGEITDQEINVLVSSQDVGVGFRIITLFVTEDGRRLLLDRGIIPESQKTAERPPVTATVTGNLHWPDEIDFFTPDPDDTANMWFARDVDMLSEELASEPVMIILRETSEPTPAVTPMPVDTASIPNNHMEYALTWFGLALVWAGMTAYWIVRIRRDRD